jgi:hypothetical protein
MRPTGAGVVVLQGGAGRETITGAGAGVGRGRGGADCGANI